MECTPHLELSAAESDFASNHLGLICRQGVWYRLRGWGLSNDYTTFPLVRVPDDHARIILESICANGSVRTVPR